MLPFVCLRSTIFVQDTGQISKAVEGGRTPLLSQGFSVAVGPNSLQNPFVCRLSLFHLHKEIFPSNLTVVMHSSDSGLYLWLHYKLIFVLGFQSIGKSILSKGTLLATLEHIHEGLAVITVLRHTQQQSFSHPCFVRAAPCIFPGDFP